MTPPLPTPPRLPTRQPTGCDTPLRRRPEMPASCRCGRQWTGLAQAHCPTCHRHFSTVKNFDRHRPGAGGCQDPASLRNRKGEPVLKPTENRFGTTWVGAGERVVSENDAEGGLASLGQAS